MKAAVRDFGFTTNARQMGNLFSSSCRGQSKYYTSVECDIGDYDDTRGLNMTVLVSKSKKLKQPVLKVEAFLGTRPEQGEIKRTVCGSGFIKKNLKPSLAISLVRDALLEADCPTYLANSLVETAVAGSSDISLSSPFTSPAVSPGVSEEE
jgi:hypothetical protein